jgi:hypothetical protein
VYRRAGEQWHFECFFLLKFADFDVTYSAVKPTNFRKTIWILKKLLNIPPNLRTQNVRLSAAVNSKYHLILKSQNAGVYISKLYCELFPHRYV